MFELLAALGLLIALLAALGLSYRRARRRLRGELASFRRIHHNALGALIGGQPGWHDETHEDHDGWRVLVGVHGGLALRLAAEGEMRRSTFIEYTTRLTIEPPAGRAFAIRGAPLALSFADAAEGTEGLATLAPGAAQATRLAALATQLTVDPRQLVLVARPSEPAVRRYSYGIRLQLDPAVLTQLVEAGRELAGSLLPDQVG